MEPWQVCAADQGGAIARPQLVDLGMSPSAIDRRRHSGLLVTLHPGVYGVGGAPATVDQRRWAALLAVGTAATLSFETAARVHQLATVSAEGPVVCTVPHSGSQHLHGVVVHQIDDLDESDVLRIEGMPITSVRRTIVDLAAIWRLGRMALVLDDAVAARKTSIVEVGACLRSVARRGKPGVRLLTTLLDERGPGTAPPESVLERSFFSLLERHRLPRPVRQHPLPRLDGGSGRVDAAWPALRLIVEIDGRRWHQRVADLRRDRDRDLQAAAKGWLIVRLLHEHIVDAPDETVRELTAVIAARTRQLGTVA